MADMNDVKELIKKHKPALSISRMSTQAKERFTALAKAQFCDDYGMTILFLLDKFEINEKLNAVLSLIMELDKRISKLEEGKKEIKTLSGKVLGVKCDG